MNSPAERVLVRKVRPAVGASGDPGPGTTPPTTDDVRSLEGREVARADLERLGHVEWHQDGRATLHAGGMTFELDLEAR